MITYTIHALQIIDSQQMSFFALPEETSTEILFSNTLLYEDIGNLGTYLSSLDSFG